MKLFGFAIALASLLTLFIAPAAGAATVGQMFEEAVSVFNDADSPEEYGKAAETFRTLHETYRIQSPELLLNLGVSEFLSRDDTEDRAGEAVLALSRAIRVAPDSLAAGLARKNLQQIRRTLNETQSGRTSGGFVFAPYNDTYTALFSWINPDIAAAVFIPAWFILILIPVFRRRVGRKPLMATAAIMALIVVASGVATAGALKVKGYTTGVLLDSSPCYDELLSIEPAGELPEGLEFRLDGRKDQRVRITLSSGRTAWVPADRVGVP